MKNIVHEHSKNELNYI